MKARKPASRWGVVSLSVLLHLALAAALFGSWWLTRSKPVEQNLGIEARVVTQGGAPPVRAPEPEPEPEPPPEPVPDPDEAAAEIARQQAAAAEAARVAEERRVAQEREAAELQARKEADRKAREQADRERAEREKAEKEKAERERLAKEKAARDKAEQEKLQAERARAAREAELNALLAADQRQATARDSSAMRQYIAQIANRIERNWIRPATARAGLECEVQVTQVPGGAVTDVKIGRCNGDESVRQSLEAAVYRASPLPQPSDPALFERSLVVTFRPD